MKVSFSFFKVSFSVSIKELISRVFKVGVGALLSPPTAHNPEAASSAGKNSRENEGEAAACHLSHRRIEYDHDQMPLMCAN